MQITPFSYVHPFLQQVQSEGESSLDGLLDWVGQSREVLDNALKAHGAILFRGFDIGSPEDFERFALAVSPDLKNQYLGTSPRNARSTYVFNASELPAHYPIMQHCEMSFLPSAPTRLFFCCTEAPQSVGGETPLADCSAVWKQLDVQVRERFLQRGIRVVRNYSAPGATSRFDPWQLKSWPEVFGTDDRQAVERIAAGEGTRCEWRDDGGLRLVRDQAAVQAHPQTGEPVWFNHLQVFHSDAARFEYRHILQRQPSWRAFGVLALLETLTLAKRLLKRPEDFATQVFYADGGDIPLADVEHVLHVFWCNMVFPRWQKGDVVMIDNFRVSHGRMPYAGPREVLVAFTEGQPTGVAHDGQQPSWAEQPVALA